MDKTKHIEAIESRRPGSTDLADFPVTERAIQQDAELRAFASFVDIADKRISGLMHAVAIPDGLAERLQAAVQAASQSTQLPSRPHPEMQSKSSADRSSMAMPSRFGRISRRKWTALAAGLAVCAAFIMMATSYALRSWNHVDIEQLYAVYDEADSKLADWQPFSTNALGRDYRFPGGLVAAPISWQEVSTSLDSTARIISLKGNAKILVLKTKNANSLPTKPLDKIYEPTGGKAFTAWSQHGLIYLVAANDEESLRDLFPSNPPIAFYQRLPVNFLQSA
jgi:hypothetical protein